MWSALARHRCHRMLLSGSRPCRYYYRCGERPPRGSCSPENAVIASVAGWLLAVLYKSCIMFVGTCCYRFAVFGDQKLYLLLYRTMQPSFGTGVCAGGLKPVSAVNQVLNKFQVVCPHHREELIVSAVLRVLKYPIAVRRWVLCVANGCV